MSQSIGAGCSELPNRGGRSCFSLRSLECCIIRELLHVHQPLKMRGEAQAGDWTRSHPQGSRVSTDHSFLLSPLVSDSGKLVSTVRSHLSMRTFDLGFSPKITQHLLKHFEPWAKHMLIRLWRGKCWTSKDQGKWKWRAGGGMKTFLQGMHGNGHQELWVSFILAV